MSRNSQKTEAASVKYGQEPGEYRHLHQLSFQGIIAGMWTALIWSQYTTGRDRPGFVSGPRSSNAWLEQGLDREVTDARL